MAVLAAMVAGYNLNFQGRNDVAVPGPVAGRLSGLELARRNLKAEKWGRPDRM